MSSALSPRAIRRILAFTEDDYSPRTEKEELNDELRVLYFEELAHNVRTRWKRNLQLENLHPLNRRLMLKNPLGEKDAQDVFAYGKPLVYDRDDFPRLLVPMIVETFQHLNVEPSFLDITIAVPMKNVLPRCKIDLTRPVKTVVGMDHPADVWPQVYDRYLPCRACTTIETSKEWRIKNKVPVLRPIPLAQYAVEKFHVPSTHFDKQLLVELHFALGIPQKQWTKAKVVPVRPASASEVEKIGLHKVTVRLVSGGCGPSTLVVARKSKSVLLLPEFTSEVYGFLDRAHVGTSLTANRGLKELLFKLKNRLPMHHLMCSFEKESLIRAPFSPRLTGDYWLIVHHFRRDLTYSDVRRLKIHATAGFKSTVTDCILIRRCLSNSHVADFKAPPEEPRFSLKMLAALVDRNFSVGLLRLRALDGPLTDYRSMDAVFGGGMRLGALNLSIQEEYLERLIKTTDFLRMSTVKELNELKLVLTDTDIPVFHRPHKAWLLQRAVVSSPLWLAGIHQLRNCALYQVNYVADSHLESVTRKLVQVCEKFERGELTETVEHFAFRTPRRVTFPFNADNKTASGVEVQTEDSYEPINNYEWDVYRFRNAATGEWLTAIVGYDHSSYPEATVLHIVKGEAYPDASYALEFSCACSA